MDSITALLEQVKIAESLAKHYESFGDKKSAEDARQESNRLLDQALQLTETKSFGINMVV